MKTVDEIIRKVAVPEADHVATWRGDRYSVWSWGGVLSFARSAIEAALKEREASPKAQPMSEADAAHLNETIDWYNFPIDLIRATERHHKITGD